MTTGAETVWKRGRFDARFGPRRVLFGRMYEDASIELDAFPRGSRVFCIASAGCTAMALAPHHEIVAVDINPVQLAYAGRRFAGEPGSRGVAERVMDFARFFSSVAGWSPSRLRTFLDLEDPAAQLAYWKRNFDTWRFRHLFDALLSSTFLRSIYSQRLLEVLPTHFGAVLRQRMECCFARHANRSNPYAHTLLLGELSSGVPPPAARAIRLVHADAAQFLENATPSSFDGFTLSNILDGAGDAYRRRLLAAVKHAAAPGALMVLRSFGEPDIYSPGNRAPDDRSMLWGSVHVESVAKL